MEELNNALDDIILTIKGSNEYKKCIQLRDKMKDNEELVSLIEDVKRLQKEYVKSNYDSKIKEQLDYAEEALYCIPIYVIYNQELNKVNEMLDYVRESLNDYFYNLLNDK